MRENKTKEERRGKRGKRWATAGTCLVSSSPNNTKVVRTWYDEEKGRRVNQVKTAGMRGFQNTKRGSAYAAQEVRAAAAKAYAEKTGKGGESPEGKPGVHVRRRGMGRGRVNARTELKKAGLEILTVSDATKDPHNGCRRKKKRRI